MSGEWILNAHRSPLNTDSGTGQLSPLTVADGISMGYSVADPATISFSMPGGHWQSSLLVPEITDVIAFRETEGYQRFRITSRRLSKRDGKVTCSFSGVSYKALPDAWIFHDTDTRSWTATEQTAIAWAIINAGQTKARGNLGLTRGIMPLTPVNRDRLGSVTDGKKIEFYDAGKSRGEAVKQLREVVNGFEDDIEPDPANPQTALKYNTWNERRQFEENAPFMLDSSSLSGWEQTIEPTEFANIIRVSGAEPTGENTNAGTGAVIWRPSSQDPDNDVPAAGDEGRWEMQIGTDFTTTAAVTEFADAEIQRRLNYLPAWTVDIAPGRWEGRSMAWLGDYVRLRIREDVRDENGRVIDDPIVNVNQDMRILAINIAYTAGIERVSMVLGRKPQSYGKFRSELQARLSNLERR